MTRTALILAAHGSHHEPAVNEQIREYVRQVATRLSFDEYGVAFHQGEPHFSKILDEITATEVTIVPVMVSDGYYVSTVLPREVARNRRYDDVYLRIARPVGVDHEMPSLLRRRVHWLVERFSLDAAHTTLAVVGHGTPKNKQSRMSTMRLVDTLGQEAVFAEVIPAFLDEEPFVESILERAQGNRVIVVPFLIAAGAHASQDIPRRMGLAIERHAPRPLMVDHRDRRIVIDRSIGMDPGIIEIIARTAVENTEKDFTIRSTEFKQQNASPSPFVSRRRLRLGTRASRLAMWQANHVAGLLRERAVAVELIEIETLGDRRQDMPIAELPTDGPFSDDIEDSLRRGEIDIAVHALKDLPVFGAGDLTLAAVLPRGDASESLVSRDHRLLAQLSGGSLIGTSSPRRAAQLLAIRPDLRTTPIRGAVEARVRDVQSGRYDAVILATAGLERLGLLDEAAERFPIETFLPAPGQAALVIQTRKDDKATAAVVSQFDHGQTRLATDTELALLRYFDHRTDVALAAYAHVAGERIHLHARLLTVNGARIEECHVSGANAQVVADEAAAQLTEAFADAPGAAA